jgi:hypothetical protein
MRYELQQLDDDNVWRTVLAADSHSRLEVIVELFYHANWAKKSRTPMRIIDRNGVVKTFAEENIKSKNLWVELGGVS